MKNMFIEFFNFNFLRKLDRYLLLNYPKIWTFKLPYIVFYGFILNILFMIMLLLIDKNMHEIPDLTYTILFYWAILMFFIFKKINNHAKIETEYGCDTLSGVEEFLLLLFTLFILGTSLFTIENIILLKKYAYVTTEQEKLLVYVDENNYSKTLAISNVNDLDKSLYKNEYSQIILDLTSIDNSEKITNNIIERAKKNYSFYYDLTSKKKIKVELIMLLIVSVLLVYYRVIGMKKILYVSIVIFPIFTIGSLSANITDLFGIIVYQLVMIILGYIFVKDKLLPFSLITLSILTLMILLINIFTEKLDFPLNFMVIPFFFMIIILFISFVKRKLVELDAEPKEL